jgi:hypothetical protein
MQAFCSKCSRFCMAIGFPWCCLQRVGAAYAGITDQQLCSSDLHRSTTLVTCGTRTTLYSAAVASPATARLACECGLAVRENENLQCIAGLPADEQTLAGLRQLGMPLSDRVVQAAALSGRLSILQHLFTERRCPRPWNCCYHAARSGSISMLIWLRTQSWCMFDNYACIGAAMGGHLAALKHLRSEIRDWRPKTWLALQQAAAA